MKKFVLGCLASCLGVTVLIVIIGAVLGISFTGWITNLFKTEIEGEAERRQIVSAWTAPGNADGIEAWLPEKVGEFKISAINENAKVPHLSSEHLAISGNYSANDQVLSAYWLSSQSMDFDAVVQEIETARDKGSSKVYVKLGYRAHMWWKAPYHQYDIWELRDWILVVHTQEEEIKSEVDGFIQSLLTSTGGVTSEEDLDIPEVEFGDENSSEDDDLNFSDDDLNFSDDDLNFSDDDLNLGDDDLNPKSH